ncbi:MAG: type II toxin-antitoxin system VapC family toxin [Gemmatimonadaceae bacterium]
MIFVDSNIPMYLVGQPHPLKERARVLLEQAVAQGASLVTSAEVLQEIVHRYQAIRRVDAMRAALEVLTGLVSEVHPVERRDVLRAVGVLEGVPALSARNALHVAVMERHGVRDILSFDAGFDLVSQIRRVR